MTYDEQSVPVFRRRASGAAADWPLRVQAWLRRQIGQSRKTAQTGLVETAAERYGTSLAVIRTAAEILRDTPELGADDRHRFAEMVLAEEARLERLLNEMRRSGTAG